MYVYEEMHHKISPRTRAVICVHLYGNPFDMGALWKSAKEHKLIIIEDATESLGSLLEIVIPDYGVTRVV